MFTKSITAFLVATVAVAQPAAVNAGGIVDTARLAAQACLSGFRGDVQGAHVLEHHGFKQRGRSFVRKATNWGLNGHTDRAAVKFQPGHCEFYFGSNRGAYSGIEAFQSVFRSASSRELALRSGSRQYPVFEVNGVQIMIIASEGSSNGSFFTRINASIR